MKEGFGQPISMSTTNWDTNEKLVTSPMEPLKVSGLGVPGSRCKNKADKKGLIEINMPNGYSSQVSFFIIA